MPAPAPAAGDELRAAGLRRLYPQDVGLWKRHCARREDGIGRDAWRNCVCNVDISSCVARRRLRVRNTHVRDLFLFNTKI